MENARSAVENLSPVAQSMANSETLRAQLESAVDRYLETDFSLAYGVPFPIYGILLGTAAVFSIYAYGLTRGIAKRNMMQKEG